MLAYCNIPLFGGIRDGFGGGRSSPAPHDIAATRLFSRRMVSQSLTRSSNKISLKKKNMPNFDEF